MRSCVAFVLGVAVVFSGGRVGADGPAGRPGDPIFVSTAFVRLTPRTPELGQRFAWPALETFRSTHDKVRGAAPIGMVRGRALVWIEPEASPPSANAKLGIDELVARGSEIIRRTQVRWDDDAKAVAKIKATAKSRADFLAADDALIKAGARLEAAEGKGFERSEILFGLAGEPGGEGVAFLWSADHRGLDFEPFGALPTARWLTALDRPFVHVEGRWTFVFLPAVAASATALDTATWEDWTYTTALLALDRPLYRERPQRVSASVAEAQQARKQEHERILRVRAAMKTTPDQALAAIREALADGQLLNEPSWEGVADFAAAHRAFDLALEVRSRYQPVGMCSMDTQPQMAARRYADLCFAAGRLGCFLNLQVEIMGDQFQRVAYSSFGEAAHATEAEHLRDIGIDVNRFLRGLVFRFAVPGQTRRELDPWRLARSIREARESERMTPFLAAAASRATLDPFNRLRAAETYAWLRLQQEAPWVFDRGEQDTQRKAALASIGTELAAFKLPEPAAAWARGFGR